MKPTLLFATLLVGVTVAAPTTDDVGSAGSGHGGDASPGYQSGAKSIDDDNHRHGRPHKPGWIDCDTKRCPGCQFGAVCRNL